jgi:predicted phosphodiesterase
MKIAVIADPHANFIALQAVSEHIASWQPDHVIVAGDLVNRGPRPAECLGFVLDKQQNAGWRLVRGNHEDYVINQAAPQAGSDAPTSEVHRPSYWTYQQLAFDISALQAMPFQQSIYDPSGAELRFLHASMASNRDGIYPESRDPEIKSKLKLRNPEISRPPVVVCVGHTHRPFVRESNGLLLVNAGSSGLPFDGDYRPSYAQIIQDNGGWNARIVRVEYDRQQVENDFSSSGYLDGGGPLVKLVLIELRTASSQLYYWATRFQELALAGGISVDDSVDKYLAG